MTKSVNAHDWSSVQASFDGRDYTNYPAGDKPTGPQLLPTLVRKPDKYCGSRTGNYNGKGAFLRLYGDGMGRASLLGTTTGCRMYIRDPAGDNAWHEVDNYRYLILSKVYTTHQLQELCVQIGNVGGTGIVDGNPCDIKINVNGTDSNILAACFVCNPGRFAYVNNVSGSDATALWDSKTSTFRFVQHVTVTGGVAHFDDLWDASTAQGEAGLRGGDTVIPLLTGTPWSDQTGYDARFCRFKTHHGSPPTGSVGTGYIMFDSYPGPIQCVAGGSPTGLGNRPEDMIYTDPSGGGGCLQGCSSSFALPVGTLGAGQYWGVSNWVMSCDAASRGDAGGVNFQYGAHHTYVVGCQFGPWPSSLDSRSGFVAGDGDTIFVGFNRSFDIECNSGTTANLNHHIYFDSGNNGGSYNQASKNVEICYNWCSNKNTFTTGGSLIQIYGADASGANAFFAGINIHHNFLDFAVKYGINLADQCRQATVTHNIVLHTGNAGIRTNMPGQTSVDIVITHNLTWDCGRYTSGPYQAGYSNEAAFSSGSVKLQHNSFVLNASRAGAQDYIIQGSSGTLTVAQNHYYDALGTVSPYSGDANPITGDPLWQKYPPAIPLDFTVRAGSPLLGACTLAEILAAPDDFFRIARPVPGTGSPGATKNDPGPFQGVGT